MGISATAQVRCPSRLTTIIIDWVTNEFPVGHFRFTTISTRNKGIDARAINEYLEHHGLDQRVKIFFADNAGEHKSHDSDDELPGLLAESSDSGGENNDHDDVDDDDFIVLNKKSTTPEPQLQQEKQTRHPTSTYFDEFELNPDLPESIYFREPLDTDDEDETSTEVIEKMEPKASTTRSGRTYATANTAKAQLKPGFDIHEGKEVNIKGFLSIGNEDIDAGGVISNAFLARVLVKALKAHARENPDMRKEAAKDIALLRNPKTVREALETPQRKEWIETIRKEMQSLVDKRVFEIKKVPSGRKVIPLRIVLKIKLASNGTIDKYKADAWLQGLGKQRD
jgi:hypothetical protein